MTGDDGTTSPWAEKPHIPVNAERPPSPLPWPAGINISSLGEVTPLFLAYSCRRAILEHSCSTYEGPLIVFEGYLDFF